MKIKKNRDKGMGNKKTVLLLLLIEKSYQRETYLIFKLRENKLPVLKYEMSKTNMYYTI